MFYSELLKTINKEDINSFNYLCKYYINLTEEEYNDKSKISKRKIKKLSTALLKSKKYPLQYIVGNVDFYGYIYKVNKNVLIPRFETEELVDNLIKMITRYYGSANVKILDLCTGSGCIGITLKKKLKNADVTLSDISKMALKVAKENSKDENINVIHSDLFKKINDSYDVIVSNPPYISYDEEIMDIVKNNEPKKALFAKNNGLFYYKKILKHVDNYLNSKYIIAFEIGYKQKDEIIKLVEKYLPNSKMQCMKDIYGRDRMFFITNFE